MICVAAGVVVVVPAAATANAAAKAAANIGRVTQYLVNGPVL